jgi:hypothetical protein
MSKSFKISLTDNAGEAAEMGSTVDAVEALFWREIIEVFGNSLDLSRYSRGRATSIYIYMDHTEHEIFAYPVLDTETWLVDTRRGAPPCPTYAMCSPTGQGP